MIDYDSFSRCHLTDIFFAFHAGAKELKSNYGEVVHSRHCFSKVSEVPGYILLGLFCTCGPNFLAIGVTSDSKKFYLFNFTKCIEAKFKSYGRSVNVIYLSIFRNTP